MKTPSRLRVVALCALLTSFSFSAATAVAAESTQSVTAADTLAGSYVGTWQSGPESGQLRIKLSENAGVWSAEASFTYGDAPVPAKVVSVKVTGSKLELVMSWQVEETKGESRLTGESADRKKFEGTYESTTSDGTSSGTWTVSRA